MIPKRVVLDTNVCLDLFVFGDPRWRALHEALRSGGCEAVTSSSCRTEWLLVLEYPHLPLTPALREQAINEFDRLITCLPDIVAPHDTEAVDSFSQSITANAKLPRCRDTDDQKFLEVAYQSRASMLLTQDKALLKLAGKARRAGLFAILSPQQWVLQAESAVLA